jgi:hypothetical protein
MCGDMCDEYATVSFDVLNLKIETTWLPEIDIRCGLELLFKLRKGTSVEENINSDLVTV